MVKSKLGQIKDQNVLQSRYLTRETKAMEKYVNDSLAAGIIWPSSSPAGAGRVGKNDKSLRPCTDYRGLSITNSLCHPFH